MKLTTINSYLRALDCNPNISSINIGFRPIICNKQLVDYKYATFQDLLDTKNNIDTFKDMVNIEVKAIINNQKHIFDTYEYYKDALTARASFFHVLDDYEYDLYNVNIHYMDGSIKNLMDIITPI